MKKRIISIFLIALVATFVLSPITQAASVQEYETVTYKYLDNGVTVETILVVHEPLLRSSTKTATKTDVYKYNGTAIATVSLTATFGYDGSTAWVNSTSVSKTTYDGWSYGSQSISTSGGTASLSARLTKLFHTSVNVSISMTCTASGAIS